jgi:tRNA-specific 2-thiouridylase
MMIESAKKKKVFVGMSGGVDSSVSAYLLKEAGYDVTGVFIKVWQPDFIECTSKEDRLDAMRVSSHLDIPFVTLNLEKEYKEGVIDYMINEYREGRTPNPDVFCNREVKFGGFWKWAKENGADYIATGHYARTNGSELLTAIDTSKDQTYFLWKLTSDDLEHVLFPTGHLLKSEVRDIAKRAGLPVATKKDSQGLCFIGTINVKEFLKEYIEEKEGDVLAEDGTVLGKHNGSRFYTIGERHGFYVQSKNISSDPFYIIRKDAVKNTLTVSHDKPNLKVGDTFIVNSVSVTTMNFPETFECLGRERYRAPLSKIELQRQKDGRTKETYIVTKKEGDLVPISGQSLVFYDGERCLGGGIMK